VRDHRGHVARRGVGVDALLDAVAQGVIERKAFVQPHEEHDAHVVLPRLADHDRFDDFFETAGGRTRALGV
jgi:hypothetical protein